MESDLEELEEGTLLEKINSYIEDNDIQINQIDLGEKEPNQIKADPIEFSELIIKLFYEFRKNFASCEDPEVKEIMNKTSPLVLELVKLKAYKFRNVECGKSHAVRQLVNFINSNYFDLLDFFDLCEEVYLG